MLCFLFVARPLFFLFLSHTNPHTQIYAHTYAHTSAHSLPSSVFHSSSLPLSHFFLSPLNALSLIRLHSYIAYTFASYTSFGLVSSLYQLLAKSKFGTSERSPLRFAASRTIKIHAFTRAIFSPHNNLALAFIYFTFFFCFVVENSCVSRYVVEIDLQRDGGIDGCLLSLSISSIFLYLFFFLLLKRLKISTCFGST